jgi:Fe2+ or Zn2+ uptake regulation protein
MTADQMIDIEKARRDELRWMILRALYAAQPLGTTEVIVMKATEPVVPGVTLDEIRRALDYLAERNLIAISNMDSPVWFAKINRYGIDIVEYTVECHPGIARPKQW